MPREQKIGLTLLILAIGLAGAFCFRRPGPEQAALPGLPGEDKINRQLADLRTRPLLPGIDLSSPNVPPLKPSEQLVQELAGLPISRLSERADRYAPPPISTLHDLRESQRAETPPSDPRQIRRSAELSPSAERPHGSPLTPTISRGQPSGSGSRNPFDTATLPSEQIHEVQVGETLTGIAVRYLGSASLYKEIY